MDSTGTSSEEESEVVDKIKELALLIGSGQEDRKTGWERLSTMVMSMTELSEENFNYIISPILDILPNEIGDHTSYAFSGLYHILALSNSLSKDILHKVVLVLSKTLGVGNNVGDCCLCLGIIVSKNFKELGEDRTVVIELFNKGLDWSSLFQRMSLWLQQVSTGDTLCNEDAAIIEEFKKNFIPFYLSVLSTFGIKQEFSAIQLKILEEMSSSGKLDFNVGWEKIKNSDSYVDLFKSILIGSLVFPEFHQMTSYFIAAISDFLIPTGYWQDLDHHLIENLNSGDLHKATGSLVVVKIILEECLALSIEQLKSFIEKVFSTVFDLMKENTMAAEMVLEMMAYRSATIEGRKSRISLMKKLSRWLGSPDVDKKIKQKMTCVMKEFIDIEGADSEHDPSFLMDMTKNLID